MRMFSSILIWQKVTTRLPLFVISNHIPQHLQPIGWGEVGYDGLAKAKSLNDQQHHYHSQSRMLDDIKACYRPGNIYRTIRCMTRRLRLNNEQCNVNLWEKCDSSPTPLGTWSKLVNRHVIWNTGHRLPMDFQHPVPLSCLGDQDIWPEAYGGAT